MLEELVQQYLSQMTIAETLKSNSYFEGGYWLQLWNVLLGLFIAWLLLFKGWSVRLRNFSKKMTRFSFIHNFIYSALYLLASTLIGFALSLYQDYFREHQYGLSNQSLLQWLVHQGKGLILGMIVMGLLVSVLYWIVKKLKEKWWMWGAGFTTLFMAFFMLIYPVFVAPAFNTYEPLEEGPLKSSILSMARSNGIDAQEIYQFDASKQSQRISANVSGLWGTMRISLNDNLLNRTSPEEIKAVMGHEIGHFVLNHVVESLIYIGLLLFIGFAFVNYSMEIFLKKWGSKMGIQSITDIAGLPLAMALLSVYFFAITPITNSIIRSNEVEADVFGLNIAREPDGFAKVALKLSEYRKISPGPLEEMLFFDHPSGENRIRCAMKWKIENP